MKFLDIIRPYYGAITICNGCLGAPRHESVLDQFDKDGITKMDANYDLFAELSLEDHGFENGSVRFKYNANSDVLEGIFLDVCFTDDKCATDAGIKTLYDYLSGSGLFDAYHHRASMTTYQNAINSIFIDDFGSEFNIEVYLGDVLDSQNALLIKGENTHMVIQKTISSLIRREDGLWQEYLMNANKA